MHPELSADHAITTVINQAIKDRIFPGCVVGYICHGHTKILPFGTMTYHPDALPVQQDTYYDVASITKSIPTGSIILKLLEENQLKLDDLVTKYLPEVSNPYRDRLHIKHLLTYTVILDLDKGLSAYVQEGTDAAGLWKLLFNNAFTAPPGQKFYYTNAPAVLLGLIAERITGQPLDALAHELLFAPLHMKHTTFYPESLALTEIAPTEIDWRGEVHGQIHDEMTWAFRKSGYLAGNAGLFSTAEDLLRFAAMLLGRGTYNGKQYFRPETVKLMHTNQIAYLNDSIALGWELHQPFFMGTQSNAQTFGKTGFTGCSLVIDPVNTRALVLLSNRTYPHRPSSREAINRVRAQLADIIFASS